MKRGSAGICVMDRIALAAIVAAAVLILTMVELAARSAPAPIFAGKVVAMATHFDSPAFAKNGCQQTKACTLGRK
jgi:hypothetical protein